MADTDIQARAVERPPPARLDQDPEQARKKRAAERPPFPVYSVALVQNESEMVQAPAFNLMPFLENEPQFAVELFTERTFEGLLHNAPRFDCVVIGYNAAWKSSGVVEALNRQLPDAGLCVLHQREPGHVTFMKGDVGVDLLKVSADDQVVVASGVHPADEILLNYPAPVERRVADEEWVVPHTSALCALVPGAEGRWRTVLEVGQRDRHPVLIRTPTGRAGHPIVVCTVLLRPDEPDGQAAALLRNIVAWAADGRPHAVVLDGPEVEQAEELHHKLRVQGAKAIRHWEDDPEKLDFDEWPVRRTADLIIPAGGPVFTGAKVEQWLAGGGRIIQLGEHQRMSIEHGASDAAWVARLWAAWFHATSPDTWVGSPERKGSLVRTRAVLSALHAFSADAELSGRLHLPKPEEFLDEVERLVKGRINAGDRSVDETVSATVAALELEQLVGGDFLGERTRIRFEAWLDPTRFGDTADRLEVLRHKGNGAALIAQMAEGLPEPLSTVTVTKLREAAVACCVMPADVPQKIIDALDSDAYTTVVEHELRTSPLLAARYLHALCELGERFESLGDKENRLANAAPENLDAAVLTLAMNGRLRHASDVSADGDHELICAEARALTAYFGRHPVATHAIPGEVEVSPQLVDALLSETQQLRKNQRTMGLLEARLTRARDILGVIALLLAAGVTAAADALIPELGTTLGSLVTFVGFPVVTLFLFWLLNSQGLSPGWIRRIVPYLSHGRSAVIDKLSAPWTNSKDATGGT